MKCHLERRKRYVEASGIQRDQENGTELGAVQACASSKRITPYAHWRSCRSSILTTLCLLTVLRFLDLIVERRGLNA